VARVSQSKISQRDANAKKVQKRQVEENGKWDEGCPPKMGEKQGKLGAAAGVDNQLRKREKLRPQHYKCG